MRDSSVAILRAHAVCSRTDAPLERADAMSLATGISRFFVDIPEATRLYFATTVGAIELLESGECDDTAGKLFSYFSSAASFSSSVMVSAACAGGQQAVTAAVRAIAAGRCKNAMVVALDGESEFVRSGFTSLGAVSPTRTRPYDAGRDGLTLGGGAGVLLLGAGEGDAFIAGVGTSCDAAHITAPDAEGGFLAGAIRAAIADAGLEPGDIGGIVGHGTGTVYNDSAEIAALNEVFGDDAPPLVSVKAFTGHTLAATGVIQIVSAVEYLRQGFMPGQHALQCPMPGAERFVSAAPRKLRSPCILSLNAGFGGINNAVVVKGVF